MKNTVLSMVQMQSDVGRTDANITKMERFINDASRNSADIVCFPESCITGYTTDNAGKYAIGHDDPAVERIRRMSEDHDMTIVSGFMERAPEGLYVCQTIVSPSGDGLSYRKTHLGFAESTVFLPGNDIPVVKIDGTVIGLHLCWESHIPEISAVLRGKGAEIVLVPHCTGIGGGRRKETWDRFLPARANDNGMYVAACNAVGPNGRGAVFGGGCVVFDPKGRTVAEYYGDDEHMMTVGLKGVLPRDVPDGDMMNISYFDRRRPELYRTGF